MRQKTPACVCLRYIFWLYLRHFFWGQKRTLSQPLLQNTDTYQCVGLSTTRPQYIRTHIYLTADRHTLSSGTTRRPFGTYAPTFWLTTSGSVCFSQRHQHCRFSSGSQKYFSTLTILSFTTSTPSFASNSCMRVGVLK